MFVVLFGHWNTVLFGEENESCLMFDGALQLAVGGKKRTVLGFLEACSVIGNGMFYMVWRERYIRHTGTEVFY